MHRIEPSHLAKLLLLVCLTAALAKQAAASTKDIQLIAREKFELGGRYAVVIGISKYDDSSLNLKAAANDAQAMANFLEKKSATGGYEVKLLLNEDASRLAILKAITWMQDHANSRDTMLLFYSGHSFLGSAGGTAYLMPHDGERHYLEDTGIPLERIMQKIRSAQAQQKIIFLDSCHSGSLGESLLASKDVSPGQRISEGVLDKLATGEGTVILSSSPGGQVTWEDTGPGNSNLGYFTKHLIKGLEGMADRDWGLSRGNSDGFVSVGELAEYVQYKANEEVLAERNVPQRARLFREGGGDIYLAYAGTSPPITPSSTTEPPAPGTTIPGVLGVSSHPSGAKVFLDDTYSGKTTPVDLELPEGTHRVTLRLAGHEGYSEEVALVAGSYRELKATLVREAEERSQPVTTPRKPPSTASPTASPTAFLEVTSDPPGARIMVRGKWQPNTTPTTLDLAPGGYEVRLRLPGHQDWVKDWLELTSGQHKSVHAPFVKDAAVHPTVTPPRTDPTPRVVTAPPWQLQVYPFSEGSLQPKISAKINEGNTPIGFSNDNKSFYILYIPSTVIDLTEWKIGNYSSLQEFKTGLTEAMNIGFIPSGLTVTEDAFFVIYIKRANTASDWRFLPSARTTKALKRTISPVVDDGFLPVAIAHSEEQFFTLLVKFNQSMPKEWMVYPISATNTALGSGIDEQVKKGFTPWGFTYLGSQVCVLFLRF